MRDKEEKVLPLILSKQFFSIIIKIYVYFSSVENSQNVEHADKFNFP